MMVSTIDAAHVTDVAEIGAGALDSFEVYARVAEQLSPVSAPARDYACRSTPRRCPFRPARFPPSNTEPIGGATAA